MFGEAHCARAACGSRRLPRGVDADPQSSKGNFSIESAALRFANGRYWRLVISESSIAKGIRRIVCVTGEASIEADSIGEQLISQFTIEAHSVDAHNQLKALSDDFAASRESALQLQRVSCNLFEKKDKVCY